MPMRINGFSGMDIDSMVKQLMTAKRIPLDKLNQQKTYLSWQRESYREMNSKVFGFKTKLSDVFGKSGNMTSQTATVTGDTDAIKALATSNAAGVAMEVIVDKVATKTTVAATNPMKLSGEPAKRSTTLSALDGYSDSTTGSNTEETFKLTINGTKIEFSNTDAISDVVSKISNSSANVTATFDEVTGKFSISSKTLGSKGDVVIEENSETASGAKLLKLLQIDNIVKTVGDAAKIYVKSGDVTTPFTSEDSNNFLINGITITVAKVSDPTKPSIITTTVDSAKSVETIKSFIDTYNDLLNTMNTRVDEAKYRDFPPLTDDQKADMKENDITAWEMKAKSGLLKNDDILKETVTAMRSVINNNLGQLSSLGITTGQYYEGGKLYLDEDKLKKALESNPQQLTDLFQGSSGIINKLSTTMTNTMQKFSDRAGTNRFSGDISSAFKDESVMGKQMKEYTTRINDLIKRLDDAETRYYKQFSAMETAMNNLQSQSSSLFGNNSQ